ncbi:calcium-binding protein, partial [Pseudovibrio axinellae]|uniref:calcium-binding protein n=1 Tax=Pseudovibrio axinellae TaxID=989403 RepID=UPI003B846C2C
GTPVSNIIYAGAGNDILDAGGYAGSWQHLKGEKGDDTYLIGADDGIIWITQEGEWSDSGTDTIIFKDLSLEDLMISTDSHESYGNALVFDWDVSGQSGSLSLSDLGEHIERFEFADGTVLSSIEFDDIGRVILTGTPEDDVLVGGNGDDTFEGTDGNDTLVGREGTDRLYGEGGDDIIIGGASTSGWQFLNGGTGDDKYILSSADYQNYINTYAEKDGWGNDTVVFSDLTLADLSISILDNPDDYAYGDELTFSWDKGGLTGELRLSHLGQYLERFEFADGTVLSEIKVRDDGRLEIRGEGTINGSSMNDYIHASSGTDVIDPGSGDGLTNTGQWQNLRGYDGDDVYVIGRDAGKVYINSAGETSGADT